MAKVCIQWGLTMKVNEKRNNMWVQWLIWRIPQQRNQKLMNINDQTMTSDFEIANVKSNIFTMYFAKYNFTKQFSVVGTRTYTLMVESLTRILFGHWALLFGNISLILLRTQHPPGPRWWVFFSTQKEDFFQMQKTIYIGFQIICWMLYCFSDTC